MTEEFLKKAQRIYNDLERYRNILKAFNAPLVNILKCNSYNDKAEIITISSEPELEMKIREYFIHKIDVLEAQFKELAE